jgi:hypothetical protein
MACTFKNLVKYARGIGLDIAISMLYDPFICKPITAQKETICVSLTGVEMGQPSQGVKFRFVSPLLADNAMLEHRYPKKLFDRYRETIRESHRLLT